MKLSKDQRRRLAFINRQPSLWRHSAPCVQLVPSEDDDDLTIAASPLFLEALNADFDGDTNAIYVIHDEEALVELEEKAFILNSIHYDQNDSYLSVIRHEALFAAYILTEKITYDRFDTIICIDNLSELKEDVELFNKHLDRPVNIGKGKIFPYGLCLFNKWCDFDEVLINQTITKSDANYVSETIYKYFEEDSYKYYNTLTELEKKLFYFISITEHSPSLNIDEMASMLNETNKQLFRKLPDNNIEIGYHINKALSEKCLDEFDKDSGLYKLFRSGSRFSETQLLRSCVNTGYVADAENIVCNEPIKSSLLEGLTEKAFFLSSPGARKGVADKAKQTPKSGYLERTLVMSMSILEIAEDDCKTSEGMEIMVFSTKHAKTLVGKWFESPTSNDWELLDFETAKSYINKKITIRSSMTCHTPDFRLCKKCFGEKNLPTKYVGITAAQCITERLTQLILRTFHLSGSAELAVYDDVIEFIKKHLIDIVRTNLSRTQLVFDSDDFPLNFESIGGFDHIYGKTVTYNDLSEPVKNKDAISVMNDIKDLLKTQKKVDKTPAQHYEELMSLVLTVGEVYSSYVEMLFAHMFLTDAENRRFWRYHQTEKVEAKLGDKVLASYLSKLLDLLYRPNKSSIENVDFDDLNLEALTIYEKIYIGAL